MSYDDRVTPAPAAVVVVHLMTSTGHNTFEGAAIDRSLDDRAFEDGTLENWSFDNGSFKDWALDNWSFENWALNHWLPYNRTLEVWSFDHNGSFHRDGTSVDWTLNKTSVDIL